MVPMAVTANIAVPSTTAVWFEGCRMMTGADGVMVSSALELIVEPAIFVTDDRVSSYIVGGHVADDQIGGRRTGNVAAVCHVGPVVLPLIGQRQTAGRLPTLNEAVAPSNTA